ncbi:SMC family ATPase [Laspinema sp. A4]|uniref:exonuclease subunit SbcC n=1 Tax=Laspinema sp. D2d TaxID=2953686 RepID=UPI0021BB5D4C|nr:SMC family ATPase [Laspinema sp. D2d]MCT7984838.1 SMC family ATPase [Laspinema sp. D2d]
MIPLELSLKNFLSYREATLDFHGLHTACICGPNGAGKSSLLEALAWSLWGNSRAGTEDDIIHTGEMEARVDFTFQTNQQIYRVIRSRQRGQSSSLEFQVATTAEDLTPNQLEHLEFRALTEKGLRATQDKIIQHIKLDYETFTNSSYLRQGRADEFMLKRPSERKQVLATLLRLDHYDELAEQAKDRSREAKGQVQLLEQSLASLQQRLQETIAIAQNLEQVEAQILQGQEGVNHQRSQLQEFQQLQLQRQNWQQQIAHHQDRDRQLKEDCDRTQQELNLNHRRRQELEALLNQEGEILAGYHQYQQLQAQEEVQASKFQSYQQATQQRQQLQDQERKTLASLESQISSTQGELEYIRRQEAELLEILNKAPEVEAAIAKLQQARDRLTYLDELHTRVKPLMTRQQTLQGELDRIRTRLSARLEEIAGQIHRLEVEQDNSYVLEESLGEVAIAIHALEKKRVYQQRVREKGLERRSFMERLMAQTSDYETQLAAVTQKIQMLQVPDALCPLCDRPLDEHHWDLVIEKQKAQEQGLNNQLWVLKEQLATSDREIQILRQEYRELEEELKHYNALRERRGQLQAQIDATLASRDRLQHLTIEKQQLEQALHTGSYAGELYQELQQVEQSLEQLNYNDQDRSLALNEEKRWRWGEIKQGQIQQSQRQMAQLQVRKPELEQRLAQLQGALQEQQTNSALQQQIALLDRHLQTIGYDPQEHNRLRGALRNGQLWLGRLEELKQAQQQYPQVEQRIGELTRQFEARSGDRTAVRQQIQALHQQLQDIPDPGDRIKATEKQIQLLRSSLDSLLATKGRLEQQQQHLAAVKSQSEEQRKQLETSRRQERVYRELATAFGKNGIQALMIENVLPQLEGETNQILSRLSGNQLHVQFVTQRATRGRSKKNTKLIDTLDILIADARGTRAYETYSGGEAFRINFAIRLALARLLAHRAGTSLQMLIVDEGFGTQDREGCDRLIAAINAIASEFACILTVTHMPQFREAFQARIEVSKNQNGSQLSLSV